MARCLATEIKKRMSFIIARTCTPRKNHASTIYPVQLLYFMNLEAIDLRLYLKKRKVAASASASPEIIEVLEEEGEQTAEVPVEEDRNERPEEIGECTKEVGGTDDQEHIVLEGKDSTGARRRKGSRSDSSKHLVQYNEEWEIAA